MKLITTSILILLLLTQVFSKWLMVMDFTINKEFIAKVLCINKGKPKLKCGGKCQLMKKMAEEENNDSKSSRPVKISVTEVIFNIAENNYCNIFLLPFLRTYPDFYLLKKYASPSISFFHPPSMA